MQFVIVSGLSGAGKSKAASFLEDVGFYCVDNMPADLIPQFAQLCQATKGRYEKVALVTDVRANLTFDGLFKALDSLDQMHLQFTILFVEADTSVIIKRYKETRRSILCSRITVRIWQQPSSGNELCWSLFATVPTLLSTLPISPQQSCAVRLSIWLPAI